MTHGVIIKTRDCFFSADDWRVSGAQADGKRISSFGKDPVLHRIEQNVVIEWFTLPHIWQVAGSNLDPQTGYSD
jgi:hypothetical protein